MSSRLQSGQQASTSLAISLAVNKQSPIKPSKGDPSDFAISRATFQLALPPTTTQRIAEDFPAHKWKAPPVEVSRGVTPGDGSVRARSAREALEWAAEEALAAHAGGTYAVGGALLGPDGVVLARCRNRVLHEGAVADPTAHVERQLVDWYFANPGLPPPSSCLLVSSLDPCLMCAGAILATGFNVLSLGLDHSAGVNWRGDWEFSCLPRQLRLRARQTFAYAGVEGRRPYQGAGSPVSVSAALESSVAEPFWSAISQVQARVHGIETEARSAPSLTGDLLGGEGAGLVSPDGVCLFRISAEPSSPIRTALMELARHWVKLRAGHEGLPHFKDCTLVTRAGPGLDALSVMDLGVYGSSVEGPAPGGWRYLTPTVSQEELDGLLDGLPPLYRDVIGLRVTCAAG